ncbi:MAG: urea ABC transporter permease subunit UrtB, partial [Yoonia sp.]|nr:urea ABC transporter permease subunit UrtB [Yoonia sp.]
MRRLMIACVLLISSAVTASAQDLQSLLQTHAEEIAKPSRNSVGVVMDDLVASGLPQVTVFLEQWSDKNIWQRDDGIFVFGIADGDTL